MPTYDIECPKGHQSERYMPLSEWKDKFRVECAVDGCTELAWQVVLPRGTSSTIEPFVYYLNAAGQVRIPGSSHLPTPPGHTRCEATTLHEVRKLEGRVSREEYSKIAQRKEIEDYHSGEEKAQFRSELRQEMNRMSEAGRDFARRAMEQGNKKVVRAHDPGLHFSVLHNDERRNR